MERLAAEVLATKQEEERLAAVVLAREIEDKRLAAEALLKKEEEERIVADTLAREIEMERLAAEVLFKKEEEERLAAESLAQKEHEEEPSAKKHQISGGVDVAYSSLKVIDLRSYCHDREIVTKGLKKAELVARLEEYDAECQTDVGIHSVETDLSALTVVELKNVCAASDIDCRGMKKADIVMALETAAEEENTNSDISSVDELVQDFREMKVAELRFFCEEFGMDWKGMRKGELIAALEACNTSNNNLNVESSAPLNNSTATKAHDFASMKVVGLRQACKDRQLSSSGTKNVLIQRLEEFDSSVF